MVGQSDINYTEKNLEYLTKKLFEAARLDMKADSLTNNKPDQENPFLDRFLDKLKEQLGGENFNKEDLKTALKSQYNTLKKELKETRVFGVGKNASEKTKTIAKNCLKIMSSFMKGISKIALHSVAGDTPKLTDNKKIGMREVLQGGGIDLSKTIIKFNNNQSNSRKSRYFGL